LVVPLNIRQAQPQDAQQLQQYLVKLMAREDHNSPTFPNEFQRTVEQQE
jgi:hypothetical protein